ncbi:molybdopterin-binding protein [Gemmatimonadetes bacterium T265]|nr:molybdopterin-binding protein [Gemmatimonadetes bacterium T265]
MAEGFVSRGFRGRPRAPGGGRVPPGQYLTTDFPVLSAGPTPRTPAADWSFTVRGWTDGPAGEPGERADVGPSARWTWDEFRALPSVSVTKDIHCVTKWTKFDTRWEGVSVDALLAAADAAGVARAAYVVAFCDGGYTTNLPIADVTGDKAWVVFGYDGAPLAPEHGGPARLLVPHLYFWKSAKWVRGLALSDRDRPGFWESLGYHNRGDPWQEQRYSGD